MYGSDYRDDDDMMTCPHCGDRSYPEVGFGHTCSAGAAASRRSAEEWQRRYNAGGRRVRYTIVIEAYDSHDSISAALGAAESDLYCNLPEPDRVGQDTMLGVRYAYTRREL